MKKRSSENPLFALMVSLPPRWLAGQVTQSLRPLLRYFSIPRALPLYHCFLLTIGRALFPSWFPPFAPHPSIRPISSSPLQVAKCHGGPLEAKTSDRNCLIEASLFSRFRYLSLPRFFSKNPRQYLLFFSFVCFAYSLFPSISISLHSSRCQEFPRYYIISGRW